MKDLNECITERILGRMLNDIFMIMRIRGDMFVKVGAFFYNETLGSANGYERERENTMIEELAGRDFGHNHA